ncbi:MAG: DUF1653 domain-containing protein [Patescibacteria group bacterium]
MVTSETIQTGQLYRHFKGSLYRTLGIARHDETDERLVIYTLDADYCPMPVSLDSLCAASEKSVQEAIMDGLFVGIVCSNAEHTETHEELVVFIPETTQYYVFSRGKSYARPIVMFQDIVERPDYRGPRFTLVS